MASRTIRIQIEMKGHTRVDKQLRETAGEAEELRKQTRFVNAEARKLDAHNRKLAKSTAHLGFVQKRLTASYLAGNIAARAISRAVSTLSGVFAAGVGAAVSFEFTLAKISAISGVAGEELASLENTIRDIAKFSPKTSTEVAQAALEMSKMGLAGKDLEESLEGVVNLSVALDEEVASVGQTMVAVKNVFNKDASELTDIADMMFTTLGSSALNLEKFSTAFAFAGGSAKLAGVSFAELSGLMGVLADNGIRASTIGTQLRQIFTRLDTSSSKASTAIGEQSIKTTGLSSVLRHLKENIKGSEDAFDFFGLRAISVSNIIVNNIDKIEELTEKTKNMEKSTKTASETLSNTMRVSLDQTKSAFEDLNIELSKIYKPAVIWGLNHVAKAMREISDGIKGASEESTLGAKAISFYLRNLSVFGLILDKKQSGTPSVDSLIAEMEKQREKNAQQRRKAEAEAAAEKAKELEIEKQILKTQIEQFFTAKKLSEARAGAGIGSEKGLGEVSKMALSLASKAREQGLIEEEIELLTLVSKIKKTITDLNEKQIKQQEKLEAKIEEREARRIKEQEQEQAMFDRLSERSEKAFMKELEHQKKLQEEAERTATFRSELMANIEEEIALLESQTFWVDQTMSSIDTASAALANMAWNYKNMGDIAVSALKQIVVELTKTLIKTLILKAILASFGGGSPFGALNMTPVGKPEKLLGMTDLPIASASGFSGTVSQPTMFMAGEEGAENVEITPRAKTGAGGGGGKSITVNISGDVYGEEKFQEAVRVANENLNRETINV